MIGWHRASGPVEGVSTARGGGTGRRDAGRHRPAGTRPRPSGWPPPASGSSSAPATPTVRPRWPRRSPSRAAAAAGGAEVSVQGGSNVDVAGAADLVIVAVPYAGHAATLRRAGDAAGRQGRRRLRRADGLRRARRLRARRSRRAASPSRPRRCCPTAASSARSTTCRAVLLEDLSRPTLDGDVMVVGDDREATDLVQALAGRLPGMRGDLRRPAAQRPPGRGADGQPRLGQPPVQGARRHPGHRRLRPTTGGRRTDGPPPRRVVSLVPSLTEAVAATDARTAGRRDRLVHPPGRAGRRACRRHQVARRGPGARPAAGPRRRQRRGEPGRGRRRAARGRGAGVGDRAGDGRPRRWARSTGSAPCSADPAGVAATRPGRRGPTRRGCRRVRAVVPIWRRPWMVLGRDTFAGDVLRAARRPQRVRGVRRPLPEAGAGATWRRATPTSSCCPTSRTRSPPTTGRRRGRGAGRRSSAAGT